MVPDTLSFFLVGLPAARRAVVRDALVPAFGGQPTHLVAVGSLNDALTSASDEPQVVVLDAPSEADLARAFDATDTQGLPRWAVVICGEDPSRPGIEAVAETDFDVRFVARALRSAWSALILRRQFARERGDVWTLGRRVTHDLRNPLGCIVTTAEMMKEILAEEAPQHVPMAEAVLDSTGEMLEMINRVHLVAKASAQPKAPESFDMGAALQAAIDRLQREITRRKAQIIMPEDWPEVRAVRPWVEAIWSDLLANALRHGPESPRVEAGWRLEQNTWTFWVADNGPGVPPERLPLLFTPFHRLHTRHGGGLGLSIVHRLAELQRGTCAYQPRPGGGSVFSFTLPAMAGVTAVAPTSASAGRPWNSSEGISTDPLAASPSPAG